MINETDTKKGNSMDLNRQLIEAMADLNEDLVIATVRQRAAEGHSFEEIQQCLNTGISAVGTRVYYRNLGFKDAGLYQKRPLP